MEKSKKIKEAEEWEKSEEAKARKHQEELLDEALEETFPASDPPTPAHTQKRKKKVPE